MDKKITPRQIKAQQTKKKLYDTAIKLFSTKGYASVTIDDICAQANSSKGAFYSHFASKHDILVEQVKNTDIEYKHFYDSLPCGLSAREKLFKFIFFIFEHIESKGWEMEWVLYVAELAGKHRPRYITNKDRYFYKYLTGIIIEGQRNGEFRTDIEFEDIINILTCNIRGSIFNWVISNGEASISDSAKPMAEFIAAGLERR